jgi:hypothetical protein
VAASGQLERTAPARCEGIFGDFSGRRLTLLAEEDPGSTATGGANGEQGRGEQRRPLGGRGKMGNGATPFGACWREEGGVHGAALAFKPDRTGRWSACKWAALRRNSAARAALTRLGVDAVGRRLGVRCVEQCRAGGVKAEQCRAGGIDPPRRRCGWEAPWRALCATVRTARGRHRYGPTWRPGRNGGFTVGTSASARSERGSGTLALALATRLSGARNGDFGRVGVLTGRAGPIRHRPDSCSAGLGPLNLFEFSKCFPIPFNCSKFKIHNTNFPVSKKFQLWHV